MKKLFVWVVQLGWWVFPKHSAQASRVKLTAYRLHKPQRPSTGHAVTFELGLALGFWSNIAYGSGTAVRAK